jgi:hypothetical protein
MEKELDDIAEGTLDKNKVIRILYDYLNKQINKMIDMKYKFIHYNGLRLSELNKLTDNNTINIFDNSAIMPVKF